MGGSGFHAGLELGRVFSQLETKLEGFMAKLDEVMAKLDERDQQIANEHAQAAQVLADLRQTITDLQALINEGATGTQLQTVLDRLNAQDAALTGIIPDEPVPEPTEPPITPQ